MFRRCTWPLWPLWPSVTEMNWEVDLICCYHLSRSLPMRGWLIGKLNQWRIQVRGRPPPPLFLDQTFFGDCPPSFSKGPSLSKARGPLLSQGLGPALEIRKASCLICNTGSANFSHCCNGEPSVRVLVTPESGKVDGQELQFCSNNFHCHSTL